MSTETIDTAGIDADVELLNRAGARALDESKARDYDRVWTEIASCLHLAAEQAGDSDHTVEVVDDQWECAEDCPACLRMYAARDLARAVLGESA